MAKAFTKRNLLLDFQKQLEFMERNAHWWLENPDHLNHPDTAMLRFHSSVQNAITEIENLTKRKR